MLVSTQAVRLLQDKVKSSEETFCSGLFLSARWAVLAQAAQKGIHLIILPTREAAEYCSADLYNILEGDCIFFLPESGKGVEKSNYKSSLGIQRTAAIGKILHPDAEKTFIVSYPAALEEKVPTAGTLNQAMLENSMDRQAWWATVCGVAKSWTRLSD